MAREGPASEKWNFALKDMLVRLTGHRLRFSTAF